MKIFEKVKNATEREIRILGIPVFARGNVKNDGTKEKYVSLFPKPLEKQVLDKILALAGGAHDHIWIVRTVGLGEAHLLNFMIDELCQKHKAKNPCFVSHRAIYRDMFGLYSGIPFYHFDARHNDYAPLLRKSHYFYKGRHFYVHHCTIAESLKWLKAHREGDESHIVEAIKKWAGVEGFMPKTPAFSEEIKNSAAAKTKFLNKEKFVFFVPEANGTEKMPGSFWDKLSAGFKARGFDVLVNSVALTVAEAAYLASISKGIVALRCGFSEVLGNLRTPKHILYSNFRTVPSAPFKNIYTFEKYPFAGNGTLCEYAVDKMSEEQLIAEILKDF